MAQHKNYWDKTKKAYRNWQWLKKQTRIGWDDEKKLFIADEEWWASTAKKRDQVERFKTQGLEFEDELCVIFGDHISDGYTNFIPGQPGLKLKLIAGKSTSSHIIVVDAHEDEETTESSERKNADLKTQDANESGSVKPKRTRLAPAGAAINTNLCAIREEMSKMRTLREDESGSVNKYNMESCVQILAECGVKQSTSDWAKICLKF